jgi:hypothetical protein
MSVAGGLDITNISIIPLNQSTSNWTGNGTPITYLDKGVYSFMYNYGFNPSVGLIQGTFACITKFQPYGTPGYQVIASNSPTGIMGGAVFIQSIMNNVYIDTDDTPIYLTIQNVITAGTIWGIQLNNQKYTKYFNRVVIIKL